MNAREIAKKKVADAEQAKKDAERAAKEHSQRLKKEGERIFKLVEKVIMQFDEDFVISRLSDANGWKFSLKNPEKHWPRKSHRDFYVEVYMDRGSTRYCDECPEEDYENWAVQVFLQDYEGYHNRGRLSMTGRQDFYHSHFNDDSFEQKFGEYMARWY